MIVADVMSVFPATIGAHAPARHALATVMLHGVHHVLVMDGREIVGVVCRCELEAARPREPVARCTRARPVSIGMGESLSEAARRLLATRAGCLAVVDDAGALCGTLTRRDLRHARVMPDLQRCAECGAERPLRASCPDRPGVCARCVAGLREVPAVAVAGS
jgi:CBS-domain-containing membrane protein